MPIEMISPRTVYNRRPHGRETIVNTTAFNLNNKNANNEFWSVRTINKKETELYVSGRYAVLHHFTPLDKTHLFTGYTEKPILSATLICLSQKSMTNASMTPVFEQVSETECTGIFLCSEDVGKYYSFNGEIISCKLPCLIRNSWSLRNVVLLESHHNSLFAMTHCLAEFTPIIFVDESGISGFVNDNQFRIVCLCEQSLLLLSYNEKNCCFVLWKVREAMRSDYEHLYHCNIDGSVTATVANNNSMFSEYYNYNCNNSINNPINHHTSKEFFECDSIYNKEDVKTKKVIDDLDSRSPLVRSLKNVIDSDSSIKVKLMSNSFIDFGDTSHINNKFRRDDTQRVHVQQEPLYPKLCLQHMCNFNTHSPPFVFDPKYLIKHSTPMNINRNSKSITATHVPTPVNKVAPLQHDPKGFFAKDFYNRKYLCFLRNIENHRIMGIVKFNYNNKEDEEVSAIHEETYKILDAVYLSKLKVIVMLEENSTLSLYTGTTFICKMSLLNALIYEPDLFCDIGTEISTHDINNLSHLSEASEYGFTMHTKKSNLSLRLYLPEMVRFHLVQKCLTTLQTLLPIEVGTTLLCRWYYLNKAVDNNESTTAEWPRFVKFILENLGFRKEKQEADKEEEVENRDSINNDVSMKDICTKKSRTINSVYSIENRQKISEKKLREDFNCLASNIVDQLLVKNATTVLYSLHLVYETEKLNFAASLYLEQLATLNCSLAYSLEALYYIEYYITDYPTLWTKINKLPSIRLYIDCDTIWQGNPPDWSRWFLSIMSGQLAKLEKYPIIDNLNEMTMNLMNLFLVIFRREELRDNCQQEIDCHMFKIKFNETGTPTQFPSHTAISRSVLEICDDYQRAVCYLSETGFQLADLDYLNPGLAGIIKVICFHCSSNPPAQFTNPNLYNLLNRTDLDKQRSLIRPIIEQEHIREVISNPPKQFRRISEIRQNCYSYWSNNVHYGRGIPSTIVRKNRAIDNCYLLSIIQEDAIIRLAFPDIRIVEAYKMLQSSSPIELDVTVCSNYTTIMEGDLPSEALKEELDSHLKTITSQRTFSLPIGRGMLGLQVLNSNSVTETLHVPPLCVSGKYVLSDSGKPHTIENSTSMKMWPNFHNGVASGLMISPMNHLVDNVWILKQLPSNQLDKIDLSPEKAGVLFGLGLNGHLNKVSQVTIGDTIKSMNEMATMAVLIGLSAYNLGSKNLLLSKHISFHYRCLIPEEKEHSETIPSLSQVSAIISAGLLNFKSGDRKMAKVFIEEMGRSREYLSLDGSSPLDIELTSVTAGFSVGLIMFQQGDTVFNREHNSEELVRLVNYLNGGYRFPGKENIPQETPTDSVIKTLFKNFDTKKSQAISKMDNWNSFQTANPRVIEGECYNNDITGPGAAVALGMIFMASSNEIIARLLQCPDSFELLENIRSPLLCLRQIGWGMIMWRQIEPSRRWVEASVPKFVSDNALQRKPTGIPEKYWESANDSYLQLLVGSCFVMALRYAGTDNNDARETIIFYITKLLAVKKDCDIMLTLNRQIFEWALSTIFLSACIVTAGTGNLHLLRTVRALRSIHHPKETANYGVNSAYSMATGLLFLGGGKLTLSNSPRCAALLLIAFFPRFTPTYSGRRYHLQALRHLYVIATRPRIMCAVDIDTKTAISIYSKITLKFETRHYEGCFVYPPEDTAEIEEIEFYDRDGKYCTQKYRPKTESWQILLQSFLTGGYFFVKQKPSNRDLKSILGKFSPTKMTRGFHLRDYQLLVDFLDVLNCSSAMDGENQQRIVYHFIDNVRTNGIKDVVSRISLIDIDSFGDLCSFYDWCEQRAVCLLPLLSTFFVYMKLSIQTLKSVLLGGDILSEESAFLMEQLLE